jgi:hypothetical protein
MNVAVLTSPLQIFNFIEYLNSVARSVGQLKWTVILPIEQNYSEGLGPIGDRLLAEPGSKVYFIRGLPGTKTGFCKSLKRVLLARRYKRAIDGILGPHKMVEQLAVGDYRSRECRHLMACCSRAEVTLLDDGSATHQIAAYLFAGSGQSFAPMFPGMDLHGLILRFGGVRLSNDPINAFFTHYVSSVHNYAEVLPNQYTYWRSQVGRRNYKYTNDVLFLGMSHVETGIALEADYLKALMRILDYYPERRVFYRPHRKECLDKLRRISSLGFEVLEVEKTPVEYKLIHAEELPLEVASIASSALDNLPIIFGRQLTCRCFVPAEEYCIGKMSAHFCDILSYHQQTSARLGLNINYLDSRF